VLTENKNKKLLTTKHKKNAKTNKHINKLSGSIQNQNTKDSNIEVKILENITGAGGKIMLM